MLEGGAEAFMNIASILVPTDFSDCSGAAFVFACDLAKKLGAKITLLHVWDVPFLWPSVGDTMVTVPAEEPMTVAQLVKKRANEEIQRFLAEKAPQGVDVTARLEMGDPTRVVCELAQSQRHDLVVMGTHGRTGLSRMLAGSVAENVVRHCAVPVLTVRTPDEAQPEAQAAAAA
jgi:nucleotide-binding universal stress UspA family protein